LGTLGSVVLILLGALANEERIGRLRPSLRFWLQALSPLSGLLGVGAVVNGLWTVLEMLAYLGFIRVAPTVYLGFLAAGVASLLLGLRFGYPTLEVWVGRRLSPGQRALGERLQKELRARESLLGYAGLALGSFSLALNLFT
jgi:hypothetical protein